MKLRIKGLGLVVCAWPLCGFGAHAHFLSSPVNTTADLVREVETDSAVQARYLKHFSLSRNELSAYLWTLRPSKLSKAETVTIYSPSASGHTVAHRQRLAKNSPVFINISGKPALVLSSGNPLEVTPDRARTVRPVMVSFEGAIVTPSSELLEAAQAGMIGGIKPLVATDDLAPSLSPASVHPDTANDDRPEWMPMESETAGNGDSATSKPVVPVLVNDPSIPRPQTIDTSDPTINDAVNVDVRDLQYEPNPLPGTAPQLAPWLGGAIVLGIIGSQNHNSSKPVIVLPAPTPEPTSILVMAVGVGALVRRRPNRR